MGFSDLWSRTLVYFGIAEDEEWDDDALETNERQVEETSRRRDRQNVRRLPSTVEEPTSITVAVWVNQIAPAGGASSIAYHRSVTPRQAACSCTRKSGTAGSTADTAVLRLAASVAGGTFVRATIRIVAHGGRCRVEA